MLSLRRLEDDDIVIVEKWLNKDYVAKWFGDASEWVKELEQRRDEFSFIKHFIVEEDGLPVGFCQYYDWKKAYKEAAAAEPEGSYGIDYMIGDEQLLGKGLGKVLVKLICDKVIKEQPDATLLLADPTIDEERVNVLSIKVLEKNGFQFDKVSQNYKKCILIELK